VIIDVKVRNILSFFYRMQYKMQIEEDEMVSARTVHTGDDKGVQNFG
jgi:hypothetical protein